MTDEVEVVLDDEGLAPAPTVVGRLRRERSRGHEVTSFTYDRAYLSRAGAIAIDPELPLHAGWQYAPADRMFGVLRDCAPDRWGRVLMERREAMEAHEEGRPPRRLSEWDFLTGVDDSTRHGALRLRAVDIPDRYLDDRSPDVPPVSRLRELEELARRLDADPVDEGTRSRWLSQLIAPGSSLGGARPKGSFLDEDGSLWMAKFPSREDRHDQAAWEHFAARLARRAGIDMPISRLMRLGAAHRTFAARRFDRHGGSRRLYASAMTLLGRTDGEDASYVEIAEAVQLHAPADRIAEQLAVLYRRVLFSILIGNRDDHLRNHGFVREPQGWVLSAAFDINPNPYATHHALAIDESDPSPSVEHLRSTCDYYRLSDPRARALENEVRAAVRTWPEVADAVGVGRGEQQRLAAIVDPDRA